MEEYPLSRYMQRVYPLSINSRCSTLSISSLTLSENFDVYSPLEGNISSWDQRIPASFYDTFGNGEGKRKASFGVVEVWKQGEGSVDDAKDYSNLKRCSWITKFSDQVFVSFHDECWGVPVFNDSRLFEMLTLSGMLIDHNWTEILKRRELYREVFANFDYNLVAKMDEEDIKAISSTRKLILDRRRVRCIVDNAKCIQKVAKEYGSFSGYIWSHVNHRPIVKKLKHRRRTLLKTPKAKAISDDLVRKGFRLVSPVTVYTFMQASGMVIEHDVDCFRFNDCIKIAERSWGLTNMAM